MHLRSLPLGVAIVALLAISVILITGTPIYNLFPPKPAKGGAVTEALPGGDITTVNPLFASNQNERDAASLVFQGLTSVRPDQSLGPGLASRWTVSQDGLTYVFDLRSGVRWGDGQPVTRDDVLFTFAVLRDPNYGQVVNGIQNGQASAGFWHNVQVDPGDGPNQVKFTLKAPQSSFPLEVSTSAPASFGILPKHIFPSADPTAVRDDAHSLTKAVGSGPFKVGSVEAGNHQLTLVRNDFANPKPYLDRFSLRVYKSLDEAADAVYRGAADAVADLLPSQVAGLKKVDTITIQEAKTFGYTAVLFNLKAPIAPLDDPDPKQATQLRQAIVQSVDRDAIVRGVYKGIADPAPGPIPPTSWAYWPGVAQRVAFDQVAAGRALDKLGWTAPTKGAIRAKAGKPLQLTMEVPNLAPYDAVARVIKDQLRQVGIDLVLDLVPGGADYIKNTIAPVKYQMALVYFDSGPEPDDYDLWDSDASNSLDLAHLKPNLQQQLINKKLQDGRDSPDRAIRKQDYQEFQQLMADNAPAIFLYESHFVYAISQRLKGLKLNPAIQPVERLEYVDRWYVDARRF